MHGNYIAHTGANLVQPGAIPLMDIKPMIKNIKLSGNGMR